MTVNHETKFQQLHEERRSDSPAASRERLAADRKEQGKRLSRQLARGKTGRPGPL